MRKFFVIVTVVFLAGVFIYNMPAKEENSEYVKVVYFHSDTRCMTCNKMEKLIHETVKEDFKNEIEGGKLKVMSINFSEEENKHYAEDYNLYNQTLIISVFKNGKETKWKNSDKIWQLIRNDDKFVDYVKSEVKESLKEL
jgi:hypothetical protein